jgi:hypothetical protein
MATIYGASVYQTTGNADSLRYDTLGKDSEVIAAGDPLTISSGVLAVAGTTDTIIGVAAGAATMPNPNDTVYPAFTPVNDQVFLMGSNGDFTGNETDGGTYYKLTAATTGTVQVDQASGAQTTTSRVVEIVKVDPNNVGGTGAGSGLRQVLVRFVKTPYQNVAITS